MSAPLRLAMLGMIPGNGHPYSWSALINGYDREAMARCPYPVIPQYLGSRPYESVCIPEARVTHIWTEVQVEAEDVARAALIPHVVEKPEAVIGEVDGVIISTDDGADHVRRARPFVEAGLPVFVDKPLATTREELAQFIAWQKGGARILSSSGLRYAREPEVLAGRPWRWLTNTTAKTWERYGIHMLEPLFRILGPGLETVSMQEKNGSTVATITHRSGTLLSLAVLPDAPGSYGVIHAYGDDANEIVRPADTYHAFRGQLLAVVNWMLSGKEPYPFSDTVELMSTIIAGIESRDQGRVVAVDEVRNAVQAL